MLIALLFAAISGIPYASSAQADIRWDVLWRDSFYKQISGFTILGLTAIGLLISLRKRINKVSFGDFGIWRLTHTVLGLAGLFALIAHTGFRLGSELNFLLLINFLLLATVGAGATTVVAAEHRMSPSMAKHHRKRWNWLHIVLFWPLPILLGVHILKTYYF